MALFSNLFKSSASAPAAPKPTQYPPVPAQLPKISAPTATQLAQQSQPSPAAQGLLTPQQTPAQHLQALQDHHLGGDMVKTLAHGMPDREGVHWATQSAGKVSDKLPADDLHALKAAQTWVKSPTDANKAAAGAAAAKTNYSGPGAWAAQGAAWSQPAAPAAAAPGAAAPPRMTPHAVSASVLMSSSIMANPALAAPKPQIPGVKAPSMQPPAMQPPAMQASQLAAPQAPPPTVPPKVQAHTFAQQHPFIKNGLDIASGKNAVA